MEAAPPYAFALEREVLRVLDVGDPSNVREVAHLEFDGPRARSALHGSHLYLVGFGSPLAVIDVSTPTAPRWVGELPELDATVNDALELAGDLAYLVRNPDPLTLVVLELGDRSGLPRRIATLDLGIHLVGPTGEPTDALDYGGIAHDGTRIFILVRSPGAPRNEIIVVDVSEPKRPAIERRIPLPEGQQFSDLEVRGDLCYLLRRGPAGLAIYRLRGAEEPELLGSATDQRLRFPMDLVVHAEAVYATFKIAVDLATFDVTDPANPKLVHTHTIEDALAAGLGMALVDDRLYVSGDGGPAPILDVSDPLAPRFLGQWEFEGGWASDLVLTEGLVAIVNQWSGILLYDIGDPTAPTRLVRLTRATPDRPQAGIRVAARGDCVLVTYASLPAELLDVSDPTAPRVVTGFQLPEVAAAVALTPTHAILGYASGGLGVVDLGDPSAPEASIELPLEGRVTDLALHGDRAVVAHSDGALTLVELEDLAHPVVVGRTPGDSTAQPFSWRVARVALSPDGQTAYLVRGDGASERVMHGAATLTVVGLGTGGGPEILGRVEFDRHHFASTFPVVATEGEVFVGVGMDLVRVDVTDPRRPTVAERYRLKQTWSTEGLALRGKYIYVGAGEDGLLVYELPAHH